MAENARYGRLALLLALVIAVTGVFGFQDAEAAEEGAQTVSAETAEDAGSAAAGNTDTAAAGNTDTAAAENTDTKTEKKKKKSEKLSPKQAEAEAVKKYGTYKGKNAKRIPVITYHRIVTDAQKKTAEFRNSSLAISKSAFDRQMKWIKNKRIRTICCEELYLWHEGKIKLPPKSVLITFDDGHKGVADNALPVLMKYRLKGTSFLIGNSTRRNKKRSISFKRMKHIQEVYPDLEFQSHTYALHKFYGRKGEYARVLKDAEKQKKIYGFEYLAYPFGRVTPGMVKAYKKAGIKMAFIYGENKYAKKSQDLYKIQRIKIGGTSSFASFTQWFR